MKNNQQKLPIISDVNSYKNKTFLEAITFYRKKLDRSNAPNLAITLCNTFFSLHLFKYFSKIKHDEIGNDT